MLLEKRTTGDHRGWFGGAVAGPFAKAQKKSNRQAIIKAVRPALTSGASRLARVGWHTETHGRARVWRSAAVRPFELGNRLRLGW